MKTLQNLILLAVGLSVAQAASVNELHNFRHMINCVAPDHHLSHSHFGVYGCYCGAGSCGTPVDDLDRCCKEHKDCYEEANKLPECSSYDFPYINHYDYHCDREHNNITCARYNDECTMAACECDRKAAECFSQSTFNYENKYLSREQCHC